MLLDPQVLRVVLDKVLRDRLVPQVTLDPPGQQAQRDLRGLLDSQ